MRQSNDYVKTKDFCLRKDSMEEINIRVTQQSMFTKPQIEKRWTLGKFSENWQIAISPGQKWARNITDIY